MTLDPQLATVVTLVLIAMYLMFKAGRGMDMLDVRRRKCSSCGLDARDCTCRD